MPRRTSVKDIKEVADLNRMAELVQDKRNHKRKDEKKNRPNRHYEKVMIKTALKEL